jgi:hypothetical protein
MRYDDFDRQVRATPGLTTRQCTEYHWQILGGRRLVNYYPTTRTSHVDGQASSSTAGSVADLVALALPRPVVTPKASPSTIPPAAAYRPRHGGRPGDPE